MTYYKNFKENKDIESGQEKIVYERFDERWHGFKKHNIISKFIMYLMDRGVIKVLLGISAKTILDVGCGVGRTMSKFKKLGFEVVGIDNSKTSIAICEKRGFKVGREIFETDITQNKFSDSSFDVVFSEGLLEHFKNYEPLIKEMVRVSKKYILLIQPNFHSICGKILNIVTYKILKKENPEEIPYKMGDYIESFKKYNCKLVLQKRAVFGAFAVLLFQK